MGQLGDLRGRENRKTMMRVLTSMRSMLITGERMPIMRSSREGSLKSEDSERALGRLAVPKLSPRMRAIFLVKIVTASELGKRG